MHISVKFHKYDNGNCRIYYKGMGNQHGYLYCFQEGIWYMCTRDGEPDCPLMEGLEISVYDATGWVGHRKI